MKEKTKEVERIKYGSKAERAENGIATRLKALHSIMLNDFHSGSAILMIAILFVLIEIAPTLMKIFLPSGAYEKRHEAIEHQSQAVSERMISEINIEVNNAIEEAIESGKKQMEASLRTNEAIFDELAAAQAEVVKEAIAKWKEREMLRARKNPDEFLKGEVSK